MLKISFFNWNVSKHKYIQFIITLSQYSLLSLNAVNLIFLGLLIWVWQKYILPTETGFYSPFENSLSYIKYLILIVSMNTIISLSSLKHSRYWIYLPVIINFMVIALTLFYFYTALRTSY